DPGRQAAHGAGDEDARFLQAVAGHAAQRTRQGVAVTGNPGKEGFSVFHAVLPQYVRKTTSGKRNICKTSFLGVTSAGSSGIADFLPSRARRLARFLPRAPVLHLPRL